MKRSELTIGARVLYPPNLDAEIILPTSKGTVLGYDHNSDLFLIKSVSGYPNMIPFKHLAPIPLTEEILLKAGFEKKRENVFTQSFTLNNFCLSAETKHPNEFSPCIIEDSLIYGFGSQVNHIHQLQNLYHALTGEELEINL